MTVPLFAVPALLGAAALAVLAVRRRRVGWAAALTLVVAVATLGATGYWVANPDPAGRSASELLLTAELMVLVALVCRWSPRVWAVVVTPVAVLAGGTLIVPITNDPPVWGWDAVAEVAFWSLAGLVGAASGWYLRGLDRRRAAAVTAARREQRVQLAADLHDYVAHDVSAMVVQAQAARVLLGERAAEAPELAAVLGRIEADGARALSSMQRSIRVLREPDTDPAVREPLPGVADIPALVRRYADAGDTRVRLTMAPGVEVRTGAGVEAGTDPGAEAGTGPREATGLRGEVGNALYRVVLEALTNVRKHAGVGAEVTVELAAEAHAVTVTVKNTTRGRVDTAWSGNGLGLLALRERVESFGGTFTAGPTGDGWRVRAEVAR